MTPVVTLESVVIAHGLPYPRNYELALELEGLVRKAGAAPRTLGIVQGVLADGLTPEQILHLATAPNVRKISRRNLGLAQALAWDGATTVASSLWLTRHFGHAVFATGGIGGVHRGAAMDVSADLTELARTPALVFCAGAKAILDLPATLEFLETWGVPVVGYGTDEFPGFFYRDTGLPVDARCDSPEEVAALWQAQRRMSGMPGMLVAVPVPAEAALPRAEAEAAIEQALSEASALRSAAVTPFLLQRIWELTGERSLRANVALLRNNVQVAAACACALDAMQAPARATSTRVADAPENAVALPAGQYMSIADYAAFQGVTRVTVYRWIQTGRLETYRIGRAYAIRLRPEAEAGPAGQHGSE